MKIFSLLICETSLLDTQSNSVSCINIFEEIVSPQYPIVIPKFSIVAIFEKEKEDKVEDSCKLKMQMNNESLFETPVLINFSNGRLHRSLLNLQGLVIPVTGELSVSLTRDGETLGIYNIPIIQAEIAAD